MAACVGLERARKTQRQRRGGLDLQRQVREHVLPLSGVESVSLAFDVMTPDERAALTTKLRGGVAPRSKGLSLDASTRVLAVASDSAWAMAAGRARDWFARRPERLDTMGAAGGVMMIGLGATMAAAD